MTLTVGRPVVAEIVNQRVSTRGEVRKVKRSAFAGKVKGGQEQDMPSCSEQ